MNKILIDELPKSCLGCPCVNSFKAFDDITDRCNLTGCIIKNDGYPRPSNCPLKTIEEHDKKTIEYTKEKIKNGISSFINTELELEKDKNLRKEKK